MPNDRLIKLLKLKDSIPNDPFVDYAMALEYFKIEDVENAEKLFTGLLKNHSDYLPFYYQYGSLLINTNKIEKAEEIINKGISLAQSQQDLHTLSELNSLLDIIEDL